MKHLDKFLFFLGLRFNHVHNEISINKKLKELGLCEFILSRYCYHIIGYWCYFLIILSMMCIEPIFTTILAIKEKKIEYLSSICFMYIPPIQYIIMKKYFSTHSFDDNYKDVKDHPRKYFLFPQLITVVILSIILSAISVLLSTSFVISGISTVPIINYIQQNTSKIGFILFMTFQLLIWMYERTTSFLTIIIFFSIFAKHVRDMKGVINIGTKSDIWTDNPNIISQFLHIIMKVRNQYEKSISNLSDVYTITTVLGAIAIGSVIDHKYVNPYIITNLFIYIIIQILFLLIIYYVSKHQSALARIIRNPEFSLKYLYRRFENEEKRNIFMDENYINKSINKLSVNDDNNYIPNTPSVVNEIKNIKRKKSYSTYDTNMIELLQQLKHLCEDCKQRKSDENENDNEIIEINNNPPELGTIEDLEKNSNKTIVSIEENRNIIIEPSPTPVRFSINTKNLIKTINETSQFNGSSIDWIIIHLMLRDDWNTFELFIVRFNSSDVIKKAITMYATIIGLTILISNLNFNLFIHQNIS